MKRHIVTIVLAIVLGLALSAKAPAAPLTEDQATTLYETAIKVTKLPRPEALPILTALPHDMLMKVACVKACPSIKGAQINERVYFDADLDMADVHNAAIIFHELVHYLQWAQKGRAESCTEWVNREIAAYQAQNALLYAAGATLALVPTMPSCEGEK